MAGAVPLSALTLLAACDGPLSTLAPAGPAARDIALLWWGMLAGALALTLLVLALVSAGFRRPRPTPGARFWIHGLGLGFSLAILVAVVGAGIVVGERLQARPGPEVVTVEATGRQWAWHFVQPRPEDGARVATEGALYIPAATPIDVRIASEDVIHSFWVPRLGGKLDAIPGRTNVLRIEADRPGTYHGLSAEFSGAGYGGMRFVVIAYPPGAPPTFRDLPGGGE